MCEVPVGTVPWLPSEVGGLLWSLCTGDVGLVGDTGLKLLGESDTLFFSRALSLVVARVEVEVKGEDIPRRWICACRLAAPPRDVLRLPLKLPEREGGLDNGWESNI